MCAHRNRARLLRVSYCYHIYGNSGAARKLRLKNALSSISQEKSITCCNWQTFEKRAHRLCNFIWVVRVLRSMVRFHLANLPSKQTQNKRGQMQVGKSLSRKPTHTGKIWRNKLLAAKDPFEPSWSSRSVDSPYKPVDSKRDPFDHRRP